MDLRLLRRRVMSAGCLPEVIQNVCNGDFADGITGWSAGYRCSRSVSDGVMTIRKNKSEGSLTASTAAKTLVGHQYYFHYQVMINTATNGAVRAGHAASPVSYFSPTFDRADAADWMTYTALMDGGSSNKETLHLGAESFSGNHFAVGDTAEVRNVYYIDLTATFGAGNEPDLETCRRIFTKDYYPYNPANA